MGNPVVTSSNPSNNLEGVDIYRPIYVTFDLDMDPLTMTSSNILLQDNLMQDVEARGIHYDKISKTTVFIPLAPLKQDETYQLTITTGVKDMSDMPLAENYVLSFKTTLSSALPVPLVISTIPEEKENPVGTEKDIAATFNHDMNPNTITNETFIIEDANKNRVLAQPVAYDSFSRIATLIPVAPLASNTEYTVSLKMGIEDSTGVALTEDYIWSFTTGDVDLYDPHGNYTDNTNVCGTCHQTHTGQGEALLNQSTETALCFTCHDGSGSSFDIKSGMIDTTNNTSFHPIMDTGNLEALQLIKCSNCHNPHGDIDIDGNVYKKLLRATDGTTTVYQGNDFCLTCHGANDLKFTDTYYENTAGDHTSIKQTEGTQTISIAAHYDITKPSLLPFSGTLITCSKCHTSHSGRYPLLTTQLEENLCFECHANPVNSHSGQGNIQEQFFGSPTLTIVSKHDITSSNEGKVECSSCHGAHTVGAASLSEGKAYSDLSDPQNTKNVFTTVAGTPNATVGNMTDFCLRCHGDSPPVAAKSLIKVVPFTIIFPNLVFQSVGGWNKSSHLSGKHSGVSCEECHEPHGSQYSNLQKRGEDTSSISGECLTCHANVGTAFNQTSRHPTLDITGKHIDTETPGDKLNSSNRHAECVDCHDPHSSGKVVTTGNQLCFQCHESTKYSGASQDGSVSDFSDTLAGSTNTNLHQIAEHSIETCNACHITSVHGSSHEGLLAHTSEDSQSKISAITTTGGVMGYTGYWIKDSCTSCHTPPPPPPPEQASATESAMTIPLEGTISTSPDAEVTGPAPLP